MASSMAVEACLPVNLYAQAVPVQKLFEQGATKVPDAYIRFPNSSSPSEACGFSQSQIPVVDLSETRTDDGHSLIVREIGEACENWGFFHVINHGLSEETVGGIMQAAKDFFELPMDEKMKYFSPVLKPKSTRYGIRFDNSSVVDWRDFLDQGRCYPFTEEVTSTWPDKPPSYRHEALKFCKETRNLALKLLALISESLGLEHDRLQEGLKGLDQTLLLNRYLPCPQPHLVLGLRNHSDPSAITLLLQNQVAGLQVRKGDSWVSVQPVRNSFVVNVGDQIQILSNGRYKSVEHRALANAEATRFSIASFFNPPSDVPIGPLPELVDEEHPPLYTPVTFTDYAKIFIKTGADGKSTIDHVSKDHVQEE